MPRIRRPMLWGVLSVLCLGRALAAPDEIRGGLDSLQDLVGQLIRVQKATHAARTEWQDQEAQLRREDGLLQQRIARAEDKVKSLAKARLEAQSERATGEQSATTAEAALSRFCKPVEQAEDRLRALQRRLPPMLVESLGGEFAKLPEPGKPATQENVGERLRVVLSLTTEIEQFDAGVHVGRLILAPPGEKAREVEVLQFGLGTAFVVSSDGRYAAKGTPGADAWQWHWQNELAQPVRIALEVYRKKRPAEFVQLPIQAGRAK